MNILLNSLFLHGVNNDILFIFVKSGEHKGLWQSCSDSFFLLVVLGNHIWLKISFLVELAVGFSTDGCSAALVLLLLNKLFLGRKFWDILVCFVFLVRTLLWGIVLLVLFTTTSIRKKLYPMSGRLGLFSNSRTLNVKASCRDCGFYLP